MEDGANLLLLEADRELRQLARGTARQVVHLLANALPRYMISASNWFDEGYLIAMCLLDSYFIRKHSSSFSEHFYSLSRRCDGVDKSGHMRNLYMSIVGLALYEYVTQRQPWNDNATESSSNTNHDLKGIKWSERAFTILKSVHARLLGPALAVTDASYKLAYLLNLTAYPSLINQLFKVRIVFDSKKSRSQQSKWLAVAVLSLKLLQFYYSRPPTPVVISSIPPPQPAVKSISAADYDVGKCPECWGDVVNGVVEVKTGRVYCFGCIDETERRNFIKLND